jgi:hypothetical protein
MAGLFIVLFAIQQASSSISFSYREGAVLHIFNELHNQHINFSFLLITFQPSQYLSTFSNKPGLCLMTFSLGEGRDEAGMRPGF